MWPQSPDYFGPARSSYIIISNQSRTDGTSCLPPLLFNKESRFLHGYHLPYNHSRQDTNHILLLSVAEMNIQDDRMQVNQLSRQHHIPDDDHNTSQWTARPSQPSPSPGSEDTQNEGEFENICLCYCHLPRIQVEGQWKTIPFAF